MNKLIVLPGNSEKNRLWGITITKHFGDWFDKTYIQQYDHWERGTNEMNVESELKKLNEKFASDEGNYYVFAKSMGSLLALMSVARGEARPLKCVFFGMPLDLAAGGAFSEDWSPVSQFRVPSITFHNDHDPVANFEFTKNKLAEFPETTIDLIEISGQTHDYQEYADYEERIKTFLDL